MHCHLEDPEGITNAQKPSEELIPLQDISIHVSSSSESI